MLTENSPWRALLIWLTSCIRVHQRDNQKYVYVSMYTEREMHFKELAPKIVRPGKSKIHRVNQQDGDPGKSCNLSLKAGRISSSSRDASLFLFRPSPDWIGFTLTMESHLLYLV